MKTYKEAYLWAAEKLRAAQISEYELDARLLLEGVCHTNRTTLLAHGDRLLTEGELAGYEDQIEKRSKRIPLQQIQGVTEFMGLPFQVNDKVLCPRQDTEILVEEVLKNLHDGMRILDMCTGSGCILISLLHYSNDCIGVGVDLSPDALEMAQKNETFVRKNQQKEQSDITWLRSDLFQQVTGTYEIIVSNPPYIPTGDMDALMPEVRDHEPLMALDGKEDGLFFYREIIHQSVQYLPGGGMLFFEIGCQQAEDVCRLMTEKGFQDIQVVRDLAGLNRVVYGTWLG